MAMAYEVWDRESFNRVGTFPTELEAEEFLSDVLRIDGPAVATEMAIIGYPDDDAAPVMILEGAQFVERCRVPV